MADVRLKNICKVYDSRDKGHGGVLAVKNFSMDIKDGEFIVFGRAFGLREVDDAAYDRGPRGYFKR